MIESPTPRTGTNPITGDELVSPDSDDPTANPINGHEFYNDSLDDLQYACIFPLSEPRACDGSTSGCDCHLEDLVKNKPLCNPPGGGAAGTTQYYAKAYPGPRQLQVLKQVGSNGVVGSICPTQLDDPAAKDYAYAPALKALVDQLRRTLTP
jgi:hypothetical protein